MPPELPTVPLHAADKVTGAENTAVPTANAATTDAVSATAAVETPVDTDVPILLPAPAASTPEADEPAGSAAAEQPTGDQTRLEILEALRGGEITTDEALLLLRQLDI